MTSDQAKAFLKDMANFWDGMCPESDDLADICREVASTKNDLNKSQISKVEEISTEWFPFDEFDLRDLLDMMDDIQYYGECA